MPNNEHKFEIIIILDYYVPSVCLLTSVEKLRKNWKIHNHIKAIIVAYSGKHHRR